MKKYIYLIPMLFLLGGCAAGAATAGYAAKASTCDNLTSDGLKNVTEVVKNQVINDLHKEGQIKSDHEVYQMMLERLRKEGHIK